MSEYAHPVEKLIFNYPRLLKIEGFSDVAKKMIGRFQFPIECSAPNWSKLGKSSNFDIKVALMSILIELIKWHAKKKKETPTIRYMNKIFTKSRCPELSYLIRTLDLFDKSYNELLILSGFSLNKNYFKIYPRTKTFTA